jgi:hypothetical protein
VFAVEPSRNLVLVHSIGWQDVADFEAIRAYIEEMAPDIEVFIASNSVRSSMMRKNAARRPTLVFSPLRLLEFRPDRGKIYQGQAMSKLIEMARLVAAGLPVPAYEEIVPGTVLSPAIFGPYTIVKPTYELASWGKGVELLRTEDVRFRPPSDYPPEHPGRKGPMVAQKFIDCGFPMTCRVLTLFGVPIFSYYREATQPFNIGEASGPFKPEEFIALNDVNVYATHDPAILQLAASAYKAMPEIALQACDILRDKDCGLHLLEINPGGGTWMFSSPLAKAYKDMLGVDDLTTEFDAFETCARLLVERTRAEAI